MSTPAGKLESVPRWVFTMAVGGSLVLLIWGLFGFVLSAPALFVLPEAHPLAGDFLVIAVLGYVLGMIGFLDKKSSQESVSAIVAELNKHNQREKVFIVATLFLGALAAVNVQVTATALLASQIAEFGAPIVAIAAALSIPAIDSWGGRNYGISIGALTIKTVVVFMVAVSFLLNISRDAPKSVNRIHPLSPHSPRGR